MIRFKVFLLISAFAFVIWFTFISQKINQLKDIAKNYILVFTVPFCIVFVLYFFDYAAYDHSQSWKNYKEYNQVRTNLLDFELPDYNQNLEKYDQLGISYEQYNSLANWCFADNDVFSTEKLQMIEGLRTKKI